MAEDNPLVVPGVQPDQGLVELSRREQAGLVKGLTIALKNARVAKRGRSGQQEHVNYLESQLRLAKEVPF